MSAHPAQEIDLANPEGRFTRQSLIAILGVFLSVATSSPGALLIAPGETISENFNSIGTSATATLPASWKADKVTAVRTVGSYTGPTVATATEQFAGNDMSPSAIAGVYNLAAGAAANATDRAVGFISSATAAKSGNLYVELKNSSDTDVVTRLTVAYDVEKYRRGSNALGFSIQLYTSENGSTWTPAVGFLSSIGADSDNAGYSVAPGLSINVSGQIALSIVPGSSCFLAWGYSVTSGTVTNNAQALAIDNVVITAASVPEPTTFVSITAALLGLSLRRIRSGLNAGSHSKR